MDGTLLHHVLLGDPKSGQLTLYLYEKVKNTFLIKKDWLKNTFDKKSYRILYIIVMCSIFYHVNIKNKMNEKNRKINVLFRIFSHLKLKRIKFISSFLVDVMRL